MFFMFPSLLSSKPFPLQPLLAALSSPPPLSRPLSRFSACSQICFWLSASAPPLQPLCPLLNLCWLSALAPPFYRPAPLAASLFALKFVLAERFSAPFCRPKLPPKFVVAQRFSAPFSAFFAFALLPPLLPHPSSLAFLGFSLAIILVPAKALASGLLSRFRRFSCYHSYRSYRSYHSYRGCKRRGHGCAKITSGEHHCPPEASR